MRLNSTTAEIAVNAFCSNKKINWGIMHLVLTDFLADRFFLSSAGLTDFFVSL